MNAREDFLKKRQIGIGGSDIGAILGVSKFATPVDIWMRKTGRSEYKEPTGPMYWGTVLEDVVANEYKLRSGKGIQRINKQLAHPDRAWQIANIDRAIVCPDVAKTVTWKAGRLTTRELLEVKTSSAFAAKDWGVEDTDEIPLTYNAQAQWYLGVTGAEVCHFAVLIGGNDYRTYKVERDDELFKHMTMVAEEFWFTHVVPDVAPEPRTVEDVTSLYPKDTGDAVEASDEDHTTYLRLLGIKKDLAELTTLKDNLESDLKIRLAGNSSMTWNGSTLATWKASKESVKTDWKEVAAAMAQLIGEEKAKALIEANTKTSEGTRRFFLK